MTFDVAIVGAGPAGLSAAVVLAEAKLSVVVFDEQEAPGGQIWRAIEARTADGSAGSMGADYAAGADLVRRFRACGAEFRGGSGVWQIEEGFDLYVSRGAHSEIVAARAVLLAVGAQERPTPFPGWTLPGVVTVGAAQTLLKSARQVPSGPLVVAGSGPLPLLYMNQLLAAGRPIAAWLDTTPPISAEAMSRLPAALGGWRDLMKGFSWLRRLSGAGVRRVRGVTSLRAEGEERLRRVAYTTRGGDTGVVEAGQLAVHEGVIPAVQMPLGLGCDVTWRADQRAFVPRCDDGGATSVPGLYVAGDGGGIVGARAACLQGAAAGRAIAHRLGVSVAEDPADAGRLARALAPRAFLDALFPAPRSVPPDETIVCRCEEVTVRQVRIAAATAEAGPNQVKTFTRCGMGPCQGRQCGLTLSAIVAEARGADVGEVGLSTVRPPFRPVTLGEVAALTRRA